MFAFERRGAIGLSLPQWLNPGRDFLVNRFVRNKAALSEVISPYFARIKYNDGREDTISTRSLSPGKFKETNDEISSTPELYDHNQLTNISCHQNILSTNLQTDAEHSRPKRERNQSGRLVETCAYIQTQEESKKSGE